MGTFIIIVLLFHGSQLPKLQSALCTGCSPSPGDMPAVLWRLSRGAHCILSLHQLQTNGYEKDEGRYYPSVYLSTGVTVQGVSVSLPAGLCETTGKMLSLWSYTRHTLHLSSQSLKCMWLNYLHHLLCTTLAHFLQMLL